MRIYVDVDGTVAVQNLFVLFGLYNTYFRLQLVEEQLAQVTSLASFEALPEVQAFRQAKGELSYTYLRDLLVFDACHLEQAIVIEGAVEGVRRLSVCAPVMYCTARIMRESEEWSRDLQAATYAWLHRLKFPCADAAVFCDGPEGKLRWIAQQLHETVQPMLLVDDSYQLLVSAFHTLAQEDQALLHASLTLGAYGVARDELDGIYPMRVLPLPSWEEVDVLLTACKKETAYVYR